MIIASVLMLLFVASDLIFDYVFNFETSDYIAFIFTLATAIITFVATYKLKRQKIMLAFDKTTIFLQSNFNNWQVIFSVLDIVCGIISILSGAIFIGGVFKFVKVGYLITKFVVVTNKTKTIIKNISKFSFVWLSGRIMYKNKIGVEMNTKKLSKVQIASIIGAVVGIVFAVVSIFVPQIVIAGDMVYNIGIATGIETICAFVGTFKGYAERTKEEIDAINQKRKDAELKEAEAIVSQYEQAKATIQKYKAN